MLGKKLKALALPPSHAKLVLRDFARLKRTNASMTEHQLLRTYLEWIIELPWGKYSLDRLDIAYVFFFYISSTTPNDLYSHTCVSTLAFILY